ncbi:MAG: metallophosphoesterase [Holosporales bacterium]|nr:metallophosphoesterase [Holosporales bacterium]
MQLGNTAADVEKSFVSFRLDENDRLYSTTDKYANESFFFTAHEGEQRASSTYAVLIPLFRIPLPDAFKSKDILIKYSTTPRLEEGKDRIGEKARQSIKLFAKNCTSPYVIHFADLHGISAHYAAILMYVFHARKVNPNFCVVISGDLEDRFADAETSPHWLRLGSKRLQDFLAVLNFLCDRRLYITLGNHDVKYPEHLKDFLAFAYDKDINILIESKEFFQEPLKRSMKKYAIGGNTVIFPYCLNYGSCHENANLTGLLCDEIFVRAFQNFNRNRWNKGRETESIKYKYDKNKYVRSNSVTEDEEEGKINIVASHMWHSLKEALCELARRNPNGPLFVVFVAHDYYLRVFAFFEQVSRLFPGAAGIDEEILRRLNIVIAGGHEHVEYVIEKPFVITASNGKEVIIRCRAGGAGANGEALCLFALKDNNGNAATSFKRRAKFYCEVANSKAVDDLTCLNYDQKLLLKVVLRMVDIKEYEATDPIDYSGS